MRRVRDLQLLHILAIAIVGVTIDLSLIAAALAQPVTPDASVIFVVDESRSLTRGDRSYQDRFYNSVYFMKEALGQVCRDKTCLVGVDRFSEQSISLVTPKDLLTWGEPDLIMLDARPVDLDERSDFRTALTNACINVPVAEQRAVVLITDGVLGSEENSDFAPVTGSIPRDEFIEQIDEAIDICNDQDISLLVFQIQSETPAGDDTQLRLEEARLWSDWASTSGGALLSTNSPDDPSSVLELMNLLAGTLELPDDFGFSYANNGELRLGEIGGNERLAEVTIVGLRPYQLDFVHSTSQPADAISSSTRRNQTKASIELPTSGAWSAPVLESFDNNPFVIQPLVTTPLRFHLQLIYPQDGSKVEAHGANAIKLAVLIDETEATRLIGPSPITATLSNSYGSPLSVELYPVEAEGVYKSKALPTVFSSADSFTLRVPQQSVDGVELAEMRADFVVTDDPYIADWYLEPEVAEIQAGEAISIGIVVGNRHLLANPPRFQVVLDNEVAGTTTRPSATGTEYHPGDFRVSFLAPQVGGNATTYKVSVLLQGDKTVQNEAFSDKTAPAGSEKIIRVLPIPSPEPIPDSGNPESASNTPWSVFASVLVTVFTVTLIVVLIYLLICVLVSALWWLKARATDNSFMRFIRIDEAMSRPWVWFTWPFSSRFHRRLDQLQLLGPGTDTDSDVGITKVIDHLTKRYRSYLKDDIQTMRMWDDAFKTMEGSMRLTSPHRSIYIEAASKALFAVIQKREQTFTDNPSTEGPTPLDLYCDLLGRGFEPILSRK